MVLRDWCRASAFLRTSRAPTRASTYTRLHSSDRHSTINSFGVSRHSNVTVLVVGSSVPGLNNLTQTVPGCDAKAVASASHGCNATSVALSIFNPFSKKTKSGSFNIPNKTFQKNLFNDSFSCPQSGAVPAFNGDISVDLTSTIGGDINYAITFAGILSALDSSALSLVVGFDASVDGTLSLTADLTVSPRSQEPRLSSAAAHNGIFVEFLLGHPFHRRYSPVHGRHSRP